MKREHSMAWTMSLLLVSALGWPGMAAAQAPAVPGAERPNGCGIIYTGKHYGPYDYRIERYRALQKVEDFHFTPEIEAGIRGKNGAIGGDINYTLKAAPNHHRALVTLTRLTQRAKADQLEGMEWPIECYYDRALRYMPDDTTVRMLYAQFLHGRKRTADAVRQLDLAQEMAADNPFTHYNLGLVYFEVGQFEKSLAQAHKALSYGFPRQDLVERLKAKGVWKDPVPPTADASAAAAGAGTAAPSPAVPMASASAPQ